MWLVIWEEFFMNYDSNGYFIGESENIETRVAKYLSKVIGWMCLGLFTTFVATLMCLAIPSVLYVITSGSAVMYAIFIAQLALVFGLSFAVNKLSPAAATVMFMLYSALTGVTMALLSLIFRLDSIIFVFLLTAAIFAALSLYGFVTKKDLTRIGTLAIFGLFGIIIASIVNMFLRNPMFDLIVTCVGIVIFLILIAYDTQKIKGFYLSATNSGLSDEDPHVRKLAIIGALTLYLDFINLFIRLLSILGKRK